MDKCALILPLVIGKLNGKMGHSSKHGTVSLTLPSKEKTKQLHVEPVTCESNKYCLQRYKLYLDLKPSIITLISQNNTNRKI